MPIITGGGGGSGLTPLFASVLGAPAATLDSGAGGFATTFNVLLIFIQAQSTKAAIVDNMQVTVNNDTGANYDAQVVQGVSATAAASLAAAAANWQFEVHASTGTTAYPSCYTITIPGYGLTTFNKVGTASVAVADATAADNQVQQCAIGHRATAAINRVAIACAGSNLATGSGLWVYGI